MGISLPGLYRVPIKDKRTGATKLYFYAWRGGPRLTAEPGTLAFVKEFEHHHAERGKVRSDTVKGLIAEYVASSEFPNTASSRKDYLRYLKLIEEKYGTMPAALSQAPAFRGDVKLWRDKLYRDKPRSGDMLIAVFARVFSVAKDNGRIAVNPLTGIKDNYKATRQEMLWSDEQVAAVIEHASLAAGYVILAALWTGQRQADILKMKWSDFVEGRLIKVRQNKGGSKVIIPAGAPLLEVLEKLPKSSTHIFTSSRGAPWSSDGFRTVFGRARDAAGLQGLHFHDLRGTAVTRMALAGCTSLQIAAVTGHSPKTIDQMLREHYLGEGRGLAEQAIAKLETRTADGANC